MLPICRGQISQDLTLASIGDLSYFESVNKETIKNAVLMLRDLGIVLMRKSPKPPSRTAPYLDIVEPPKRDPRLPVPAGVVPTPPPPPPSGPSISWIAIAPEYVPHDQLPPPPSIPPPDVETTMESAEATSSAMDMLQAGTSAAAAAYLAEKAEKASRSRPGHTTSSATSQSTVSPSGTTEGNTASSSASTTNYDDENEPIHDAWHNIRPNSRLWDFCENIGRFRREGKNRRDTATVAIRVLRLARMAATWVDGKGKGKGKVIKKFIPKGADEGKGLVVEKPRL